MSAKCAGCSKEGATLQCPTCKKLGLPPTLFCGQPCFQASWATHKKKHDPNALVVKTMNDHERALFDWTGPLRPGLITPKRTVAKEIVRPDYVSQPDGTSPAEEKSYRTNKIIVWNKDQMEGIRKVCTLSREVLDAGIAAVKVGATTDDIDRAVHEATVARGAYPSPLGYMHFPKSCCTSINEVICHGIPDSTVLQEGDIVNVDVSCYFGGFHGDLNETVFVGKPDAESVQLVHNTYECMMAGINICKPHVMYKHIGEAVQPVADTHDFGVVRGICAHGIGELFHCAPNIPHYAGNKTPGIMKEGHVFTVEPMINAGSAADSIWPDNWTCITTDGKRSAQFEHTLTVTKDGYEILTPYKHGKPYYQVQLEEFEIPLPTLGEVAEKGKLQGEKDSEKLREALFKK